MGPVKKLIDPPQARQYHPATAAIRVAVLFGV